MRSSAGKRWGVAGALFVLAGSALAGLAPQERVERFDQAPQWEGRNNRPAAPATRAIRQDFGYSPTNHTQNAPGEIGGYVTASAEPAYYAKKIPQKTLEDSLSASGTLICPGPSIHVLLGFFNASAVNEWRTPNSMALRLLGRGDKFLAYVEYATAKWRAGAGSLDGFPTGKMRYSWTLRYDPNGNQGGGTITVTLNDQTAVCNLDAGHKRDGATFNRFGLLPVLKSADDGGEVWIDNVVINGQAEDFRRDPGWEGFQNRRTYSSANIRPQFDFGYSATRHANGQNPGELGGLVFRGDCRYPQKLACYGDRLELLTPKKPLRASGKVGMLRGVSDSTTLIGFYHTEDSMKVHDSQASFLPRNFLGIAVEGPSREGFLFTPMFRGQDNARSLRAEDSLPHIMPNKEDHTWELEFLPDAKGGGTMRLRFDKSVCELPLTAEDLAGDVRFDRFGLVTTWIDGNGQNIYFDDLRYTFRQE